MKKNELKVLNVFITPCGVLTKSADVFDIMYETSLNYPETKKALEGLAAQKLVFCRDIKTYEFIGDPAQFIGEKEREPERGVSALSDIIIDLREKLKTPPVTAEEARESAQALLHLKAIRVCTRNKSISASELYFEIHAGMLRSHEIFRWLLKNKFISSSYLAGRNEVLVAEEHMLLAFGSEMAIAEEVDSRSVENALEILDSAQEPTDDDDCEILETDNTEDDAPSHSLWKNDEEFSERLRATLKLFIRSNKTLDRTAAIARANITVSMCKSMRDEKRVQLYENIVYHLSRITDGEYEKLRASV